MQSESNDPRKKATEEICRRFDEHAERLLNPTGLHLVSPKGQTTQLRELCERLDREVASRADLPPDIRDAVIADLWEHTLAVVKARTT